MSVKIFDTDQQDVQLHYDIVIAGAGAAGITLARQLLKNDADQNRKASKILLLESGGADYDKDSQDLYIGENSAEDYYELRESRLRFFGGTTAIWGGRCAQYDAIDFEKRDWIAHSGWPFDKDHLRPYYRRAQAALELPQIDDNAMPGAVDPINGKITTAYWQFDEKFSRFTLPSCKDLQEAANLDILLKANVIDIHTSENGQKITSLTIANFNNGRAKVSADKFVLAMGGLEIPRIMLASRGNKAHPNGIGNGHDQVGRYFMEHPHGRAARIDCQDPKRLFSIFPPYQRDKKGYRYGLLCRPSEQTQQDAQILNTCFTIGVYRHAGENPDFYKQAYGKIKHDMSPTSYGRAMWRVVKKTSRWVQDRRGPSIKARMAKQKNQGIYTVIRAEQAPNPDSRVALMPANQNNAHNTNNVDVFGIPKIDLQWRFLDMDRHSVYQSMRALDDDLQRLNIGHVIPEDWLNDQAPDAPKWVFDDLVTSHVKGGYHHIGTTRMGTTPTSSVVDGNCKVHGIDNLYIAGSSTFPTSSWANPTLTILALSIRLADHLSTK